MTNSLTMVKTMMSTMGAAALLWMNRVDSKQRLGDNYNQKITDTETLMEYADVTYLDLKRKVKSFTATPDTYPSLNKEQSQMRMTCNKDSYFVTVQETALLLDVEYDMEHLVKNSKFLKQSL